MRREERERVPVDVKVAVELRVHVAIEVGGVDEVNVVVDALEVSLSI